MQMQNAFEEERDLLSRAFRLSLDWRSCACQWLGLIGALFLYRVFDEFSRGAAGKGWVALQYIFILVGFGAAYCWLCAANSLVVKVCDERLLGHLGVGAGTLERFLTKNLASVLLMPAICYGIVLLVVLLVCIFAAVGLIPQVGHFLLAVLIVPMFIAALFGFVVAYIGLFELPALIGGERASPRENLAELFVMIRSLFKRLFFRHTLAILGAFLIAVPLYVVARGAMEVMDWVMRQVTEEGLGLLAYVSTFPPSVASVVAKASLNLVYASVLSLPVSFLSIASFLIYRAAHDSVDEGRGAYSE